jgi:hypothetical protein
MSENFSSLNTSRRALRPTQPPLQWVPGVKRPGRQVVYSPASSAEVENEWSHTVAPPIRFHGTEGKSHFVYEYPVRNSDTTTR